MDATHTDFRANFAAIAFGTAGLLMLGLQPILLEQLVLAGRISLDGAGFLAMAEIIAIGIGAAVANLVLPLHGLRVAAALACVVLAALNLATATLPDTLLFPARIAAGGAGGVLVWIATQAIVRFHAPERLAGLFLLLQTACQAALALLAALVAIPLGGMGGGFAALALACLLPLVLLPGLPARLSPRAGAEHALPPATRGNLLATLAILAAMAVVGALWTFLEAFGREHALAPRLVQLTIAGVLVAQLAGATCAAWLAPRLDARRTLLACNLALALVALSYLAMPAATPGWFIATCASFGFAWLFMMPFHVKLALATDPAGRLAVQVPALQLLGSALGPMSAALAMQGDAAARPAFVVGVVFALVATLAVAASGMRARAA